MAKKPKTPELNMQYQIDYRNIKYPRLEFKTGNLLLVLPKNYQNEEELVKKHEKWIYNKNFIIKTAIETAKSRQLNQKRTNKELKRLVRSDAQNYIEKFHFKINNIYFRKMKTKWGSYSPKRNLTLNTLLKYLPEKLIRYVIFHELVHSTERKHNERFWNVVSKEFEDYPKREKDLLAYWFLVQKSTLVT